MNKTVNINLAGIFFHIDEDAYLKLQRYLDAIKRSFTDSQGRAEIIADIEARISELFSERVKHDKQVIGIKEVDEVITIMGQPEDYLVDDEIFEDQPKQNFENYRTAKKLFRDTDNSYIGGVSSGLGHYLGVDAIWVRLLWILLTLGSGGTFIFIYIFFWILVPEAVTTTDKLMMTGEPVNISNIEKKIKKGLDEVSETVKNVDYKKYGNKVKSSSQTFFDAIGNAIMFILSLIAKFIGILLIIFGAVSIFGLFISLLSFGTSSFFQPWWMDYPDALNTTGLPLWIGSILVFFTFGIPAFFILYLGLKILINNLKSIGNIAKFSLLGLWLLSLISLIVIGIKQSSEFAIESTISHKHDLVYNTKDTLNISMVSSKLTSNKDGNNRFNGFEIRYDENDKKLIYSREVKLTIRSTKDSIPYLIIEKTSKGKDYLSAKERANEIEYKFTLTENKLQLNNFLLTNYINKYRNQNIDLYLYVPEGSYLNLDDNTRSFLNYYKSSNNIVSQDYANHTLLIKENEIECLNCDENDINYKVNIDVKDNNGSKLKINDEGVEIKSKDVNITINNDGIKTDANRVKVNIDEDGIDIKSNDN